MTDVVELHNFPVETHSISIDLSVEYAVARPATERENPPMLLALHGWGQTCQSFIKRFLPLREASLLVVAPQAPHPLYVSYEPKKVGFSWLTMYERDRAVKEFREYMRRLLHSLRASHPFNGDRVFLLGYSQGVSMAYRLAVSDLIHPAGLIACNADLPPDVAAVLPTAPQFPVLLVHGKEDPMYSLTQVEQAQQTLQSHGFPVETWLHEGGHELPLEAVLHIGEWIATR